MQYLSDVFLNGGEAHKRAVAVGIMAVILLKAYFDADSVRDDVDSRHSVYFDDAGLCSRRGAQSNYGNRRNKNSFHVIFRRTLYADAMQHSTKEIAPRPFSTVYIGEPFRRGLQGVPSRHRDPD